MLTNSVSKILNINQSLLSRYWSVSRVTLYPMHVDFKTDLQRLRDILLISNARAFSQFINEGV